MDIQQLKLRHTSGSNLDRICSWYHSQCNGQWEHGYGVSITTIDNPGWLVKIELTDTKLESTEFDTVNIDEDDREWISCHVEEKQYIGACGPMLLSVVLGIFLDWAQNTQKS
jgi:Immunity protein 53